MKKRRFLKVFIIIITLTLSTVLYARFIEPNLLILKSFDIEVNKKIEPFSIVFFTDTHFGKYYETKNAKKIVEKINQQNADIVIFGGDLLDNYAKDKGILDLEYLREQLNNIKAKIGKYAVWGNRDYGGGTVRFYNELMTSCGFKILKNQMQILENYNIALIGYDDFLMGYNNELSVDRTDPVLYKIKSDLFNLIISHEPVVSTFIESESENFLISGHTHGGQVTIPFITPYLLPQGSGGFVKGLYSKEDIGTNTDIKMFTSSGIGMTRYPFRFLNPPEIIKINFKPKNEI